MRIKDSGIPKDSFVLKVDLQSLKDDDVRSDDQLDTNAYGGTLSMTLDRTRTNSLSLIKGAVLLNEPVSAEGLMLWPLMHGTLASGLELDEIKSNGLIAGKRNSTSREEDRVLGRTEYVFIRTASYRADHGWGAGVLIDPRVLTIEGLVCCEHDIKDAFECIGVLHDS